MIILWGCELVRGSSLTLCARPEAGNAPGVLEKLRERGKQLEHIIKEAISHLHEDYREIIVLRDMEGLTYEQIGDLLQCAPGTVMSRRRSHPCCRSGRNSTCGPCTTTCVRACPTSP